jgi:hypothetical protein
VARIFCFMSGMETHIDWTAASASTPRDEWAGRGLSRPASEPAAASRRRVMDTLLGRNDLKAIEVAGGDPYNATGKHFRR